MFGIKKIREYFREKASEKRQQKDYSALIRKIDAINFLDGSELTLDYDEYRRMTVGQQLFMMYEPRKNIPMLLEISESERPACGGMG